MSAEIARVLREARKLIERPEGWVKGRDALDRDGNSVYAYSRDACAFCAVGAIMRSCDARWGRVVSAVKSANGIDALWSWNDAPERTHAEVLAAFDRAIAAEESQP